jgi:hypothetical protein
MRLEAEVSLPACFADEACATRVSSSVFHSRHFGHCPFHWALCAPQDVQT